MKILILGVSDYESQLTLEDLEIAIKKSKFKVKEVVSSEKFSEESLAHAWADHKDLPLKEFLPNWSDVSKCDSPKRNKFGLYNPRAAFERNAEMFKYIDGIIAFYSDSIYGLELLLNDAKKAGVPVHFVKPNPEYIF